MGTKTRFYTNRSEATKIVQSFTKSMATVRERYTKPGQADHIINRMLADKFGSDATIEVLTADFAAGRYDQIVGRVRQADRARAEQNRLNDELKKKLIAECELLYLGAGAAAA